MNQVQKAIRASINLGDIELDVLQFPDGSYHLFINQLNDVLSIKASDSTGKKYVQPLIEANLNQVNKASVEGIKSHLKTLSLDLVSQLVGIYAQLGNQKCIAVCIASLAESLERRADTAFDVVRSEEERNNRLAFRVKGKETRRTLTDWIKWYVETHPELSDNYRKFIYSNCSDAINRRILGCPSKKAKEHYKIGRSDLLRDRIPTKALREIEFVEAMAMRLIDHGVEPLVAVEESLERCYCRLVGL